MELTAAERAERRATAKAAAERGRKVLKPGDRCRVRICGGGQVTVTMAGWSGEFFTSRTAQFHHPINVSRLNGKPVNFAEQG
jgi:hypothetical protein